MQSCCCLDTHVTVTVNVVTCRAAHNGGYRRLSHAVRRGELLMSDTASGISVADNLNVSYSEFCFDIPLAIRSRCFRPIPAPAFLFPVTDSVEVGTEEQMRGIATWWIIAMVKDCLTERNAPDAERISDAMRFRLRPFPP